MNVHHPAVKIIRINLTTYGVSYSFVNMNSNKEEEYKLSIKEKEKMSEKKNQ